IPLTDEDLQNGRGPRGAVDSGAAWHADIPGEEMRVGSGSPVLGDRGVSAPCLLGSGQGVDAPRLPFGTDSEYRGQTNRGYLRPNQRFSRGLRRIRLPDITQLGRKPAGHRQSVQNPHINSMPQVYKFLNAPIEEFDQFFGASRELAVG